MSHPPSDVQLMAAWAVLRQRPYFAAHWPRELREVMQDPIRARLLVMAATLARRRPKPRQKRAGEPPSRRLGPIAHRPHYDAKRAAAGDFDD